MRDHLFEADCMAAEQELYRLNALLARARAIIDKQRALLMEYVNKRNSGRSLEWEDHKPTHFTERVRGALALTLDDLPSPAEADFAKAGKP